MKIEYIDEDGKPSTSALAYFYYVEYDDGTQVRGSVLHHVLHYACRSDKTIVNVGRHG